MKKTTKFLLLIFLFLFALMPLLNGCTSVKKDKENIKTGTYTVMQVPVPQDIKEHNFWRAYARYKDTKEPVALSAGYEDCVYATIPAYNQDRELEVFVPEEIKFTDYDGAQYEFHELMNLAQTGVIKGNEKGEGRPFDNVTRAEALAMIIRFIGLDNMPVSTDKAAFNDIAETDWFYNAVVTGLSCGIVEGDTKTTFSPHRNVSREEVMVMVARALQYAGLRCPQKDILNAKDKDKISDWAVSSYAYLGASYASDYDDTDFENPVRVLNPQKAATRYDIAYTLSYIQDVSQLYPSKLAVQYGFDKEMPVIDGSTSTYPFTEAVYSALFHNGASHPQYPVKHSKSHASYERLINGEVDMLFASVYPASDILKLAEEKGVELELIPIAYDAMIFFTNHDNPATGLTKEQITNIYVHNAYENWAEVGGEDAPMYPYCRNNDSGSHAQMEKHFLNGKEIHPEVQKETSYTMSNVLTDVIAAKTEEPLGYGLGYSIYYYYHNMFYFYPIEEELKLLAIDGVMPTDETIADGSYPLSNNTYVVLRKDTPKDAPARKMAEFMLTDAGQQCVENAGYGRLR